MMRNSSGRMSNVPRGILLRASSILGPSMVALIALAGVTTPPALSIREARDALNLSRARSVDYKRERDQRERYDAEDVETRARRALDAAREQTPAALDLVVAQGAVRMACERAGLELESLTVGTERDTGLPTTTDRIVVQSFELIGAGSLGALVRLEGELAALGYPACVTEAAFDFPDAQVRRPQGRVQLGLFHRAPPLPPAAEGDPLTSAEETP
jgi:hypothetical protein